MAYLQANARMSAARPEPSTITQGCPWDKEPKIDIKKFQSVATQTKSLDPTDEPCASEEEAEKLSVPKHAKSPKPEEAACETGK